jgi:hypothetical protein
MMRPNCSESRRGQEVELNVLRWQLQDHQTVSRTRDQSFRRIANPRVRRSFRVAVLHAVADSLALKILELLPSMFKTL